MSPSSPSSAASRAAEQHGHDGHNAFNTAGAADGKKPLRPDTILTHVMKVSTPARDCNQVNLPLLVKELITRINKHCPGSRILPKRSHKDKYLPITTANDVQCNDSIEVYATDLQYDAKHQQHHVFIELETTSTFTHVKYGSNSFLAYLKEKRIWIVRHGHTSRQAMPIGYINYLHPNYGSRDTVTSKLQGPLEGIEFILAPSKQYFWNNNQRTNVEVVELIVGPHEADVARAIALNIFGEAKKHGLGEMEFIPLIQNGFDVETYRNALKAHYQWCQNIVSVSIEGLKNPDKSYDHAGIDHTFRQVVNLTSAPGNKPVFTGFERTKDTESKGRYLLLTTRDNIKLAQEELDKYFKYLLQSGKGKEIAIDDMTIRRTNNTFTTEETHLTDAIAKKYGKQTEATPRRRNGNAWLSRKRAPQVVLDVDDTTEFPHMVEAPAEKRTRHVTPNPMQQTEVDAPDDMTTATNTSLSSEYTDMIRALERKMVTENAKVINDRMKEKKEIADMKKSIDDGNKQVIRLFETTVASVKATSDEALKRTNQNEKTLLDMKACMNQMARVVVQLTPRDGSEEPFNIEREKLRAMIATPVQTKRTYDEVEGPTEDEDDGNGNSDMDVDNAQQAAGSKDGARRSL